MNEPTPKVTIETLTAYSPEDATTIGHLLSILSDSFSDKPVEKQVLTDIITSPYHDQLVARDNNGTIIGTLTVSLTMGAGVIRKAWVEDFIVDPATRGMGVGSQLWDTLITWCRDHQVSSLDFTSRPNKVEAQHFYLKRGAVIRETNYFRKHIDSI